MRDTGGLLWDFCGKSLSATVQDEALALAVAAINRVRKIAHSCTFQLSAKIPHDASDHDTKYLAQLAGDA